MKSVCVYCGSRHGNDPRFTDAARELGQEIAARGLRLVYGGGGIGLMGELARACKAAGGEVLGVIPEFLTHVEGASDLVETEVVPSMHARKMRMFEAADAFLILPGGVGTLEELVETMSWASLALHSKPMIMVDVADYWAPWFALLDHMTTTGFLAKDVRNGLHRTADPHSAVELAVRRMAQASDDREVRTTKL